MPSARELDTERAREGKREREKRKERKISSKPNMKAIYLVRNISISSKAISY